MSAYGPSIETTGSDFSAECDRIDRQYDNCQPVVWADAGLQKLFDDSPDFDTSSITPEALACQQCHSSWSPAEYTLTYLNMQQVEESRRGEMRYGQMCLEALDQYPESRRTYDGIKNKIANWRGYVNFLQNDSTPREDEVASARVTLNRLCRLNRTCERTVQSMNIRADKRDKLTETLNHNIAGHYALHSLHAESAADANHDSLSA
jgi:hypothetical protein